MLADVDLAGPFFDLYRWLGRPCQQNRAEATLGHLVVYMILPPLAFLLECHLVRREKTRALRMPLGVLGASWLVLGSFAVRWAPPEVLPLNIVSTMGLLSVAIRMLDFGLRQEPVRRVKGKEVIPLKSQPLTITSALYDLYDAVELSINLRGIGLDFGEGSGLKTPPAGYRPVHDRVLWLKAIFFRHFLPQYLFLDFLDQILHRSQTIHALHIGQLHLRDLPPTQQILVMTSVPLLVPPYLSLFYNIFSLTLVSLHLSHPSEWPPLFGRPWFSTSLHDFWALRWHQVLRRTFMITAGFPLGALFGRSALIFGVFASSGFFHSVMLLGANASHFDWPTFRFFAVQAFGLLFEQWFRKLTGKRVNGPLGWLWTFFFLYLTGRGVDEVWIRAGFLNIHLIPPQISIFGRLFQFFIDTAWR